MLEFFEKYFPMGFSTRDISAGVLGAVFVALISSKTIDSARKRQTRKKIEAKREIVQKRKDDLTQRLMVEGELITVDRKHILALVYASILRVNSTRMTSQLFLENPNYAMPNAKALSVDEKINVVCDFILEATSWAEGLKNVPIEQRGSLYGLPISVKECFFVKGYDATIGLSGLINKPALEDSPYVKFIKDAHGIPFCLTNIPQTMVSYSCSNPVYGNTCNPHDLLRTPGGSSGGEGALIAAGASLLGIGSDIGGSLRIPSHFSGVVGLKPTNGRIYQGTGLHTKNEISMTT
ncbi:fatty acid amide hydrolase 1 [Eurytemora carolleeae]|uniref:fatty acid amide hydrolase 1 n=1 Tax=Eurytemora carolleeae TaxID=1294199 RepID=UPI000C791303|nr:fatty acid amide hydrolase 1 [Eurytemora carolleeae]|eukprot:XP_023344204.1 fatty acid amide hydrolase 1-like [Eurytemora affinis]